jgi:hypothetical protein
MTELKQIVVEQLREIIPSGKLCCAKCFHPLGGKDITFVNVDGQKVEYRCPNENCDNHSKIGYRTFRGLKIVLPAREVPDDLADVEAPAPPAPEEVDVEDTDESDAESEV